MPMFSSTQDSSRSARLDKFFKDVIWGKQLLKNAQNGNLFLEALCNQPDPPACIETLLSSTHGLPAMQESIRFNLLPTSLNGGATSLLQYIQAPALKAICGGDFLREIVLNIVRPPIFWNAFVGCFRSRSLSTQSQQCFAWLLLELISLPLEISSLYSELAQDPSIHELLTTSSEFKIRTIGQKIKHAVSSLSPTKNASDGPCPGGRHDNDHDDFRQISILPTADELLSEEEPFLRAAAAIEALSAEDNHLQAHLDNQFRLLREDMICEMRDELQVALGKKPGRHKGVIIEGFNILDVDCGTSNKRQAWGLQLECKSPLRQLSHLKPEDRKAYLTANRNLIRHQSLACLIVDQEVAAFTTINRDLDLLTKKLPIIVLQFCGKSSTLSALLKLKMAQKVTLVQLDTALFSFEPILKGLQGLRNLPLVDELLLWKPESKTISPPSPPLNLIHKVEKDPRQDLKTLLRTPRSVRLDGSQVSSLLAGLQQRLSVIQGPPGTGKSFIGALNAKILYEFTGKTILVVCFTNHALDQFLEDLLDIGIPSADMLRLGNKSTDRTKPLALFGQPQPFKQTSESWKIIERLKSSANGLAEKLQKTFAKYSSRGSQKKDLMEYLEFLPSDVPFYEAFTVPQNEDGMSRVGKRGKSVDEFYLLERWLSGRNAGILQNSVLENSKQIWQTPVISRNKLVATWKLDILKDQIANLYTISQEYNDCQSRLDRMFKRKTSQIIGSKRIIGCTTTAAAKYTQELQAAAREVLIVEEAGEILESHILTALGPQTEQLIMIGDHKQLRPKVNNYRLSVEKGEGYDLNRSLFERLILKGYPHETLMQQHRMRPEISSLVRALTYPDLTDAPKTQGRPNLRGFQANLVFVNHSHPEDNDVQTANWKDMTSISSKRNPFEAEMVLKCVRYLAQQGYGTDKIVVLTPYLGQLQLLQKLLSKNNDPILNDLDSYDLVRAGLLPAASARMAKKPIHLSTIDNYQGEESDIVIASMTRSNASHNIGFMVSPERLNVLLSRARDGLILIGNVQTFLRARANNDIWVRFFELMTRGGCIHDGFPVKCERHPDRISFLRELADFENDCPDGGCREPCGTMLNCGIHECPQRCHQLFDHTQMNCERVLQDKCPKGHIKSWKCHAKAPASCYRCENDAKILQQKQQKALELQQKREKQEREHMKQMAALEEQLELRRQELRDAQLEKERSIAIELKKKDLANMARSALKMPDPSQKDPQISMNPVQAPLPSSMSGLYQSAHHDCSPKRISEQKAGVKRESAARSEWHRQKKVEGVTNEAIDSIMEMIGLEDVKVQILRIKAKIDVGVRQNVSSNDERFNIVFQGNPGTGKTTVARHYAKALASLGALPGSTFVETSGSRLASDGISGVKKYLEEIQNAGGGALFLDEAYQLASGHNYGGGQVLDFLLAEMENNVGTIVFILAGYNKEMEKFFQHNPGLLSRVPYSLQFADYEDDELLAMLRYLINKKYDGRMTVDGDQSDQENLYLRVATRRLGRGRGRPGFGNARALQTMFSMISERQAERINRERRDGLSPDDFFISKEDMIGPDPSLAIVKSTAWMKLQELTGLHSVKESIQNMIGRLKLNYNRELEEKNPIEVSLNRVFLGSPGTGKTSVAKLYGQILADLGLLSNGEVIIKNPADFVGNVLGQSEQNTKAILATTVGKVLIIDEAYMLYPQIDGSGNQGDSFKTAVIDTIVAEVQSVPGEDRCVLLLGYKDEIVNMFQNVNPGLSRRFAIESAFNFEDFNDDELLEILNLKLKHQDLSATEEAKRVAIEVLSRSRNRPNFGNAGEVENLLSKAKGRNQARLSKDKADYSFDVVFEPQDFDEDFDRGNHATTNLQTLFEDVIGCENVVSRLEAYQQTANNMKRRNLSYRDRIPTNFLFKGPPGTGKTTTARKMGQVYYDMGFLSTVEVVECSASDLIGQYVGQTGPKTRAQLDKALGKVLFVDEAYRLSEGHFATEAINELVDSLTKPAYKGKMIVILAGYAEQINQLLAVNPGLSSRFSEEIVFKHMSPENCLQLLESTIKQQKIEVPALGDRQTELHTELIELLELFASLPSWGNARDIISLGNSIAGSVFRAESDPAEPLRVTPKAIISHTVDLLTERQERCSSLPSAEVYDLSNQATKSQEIKRSVTHKSANISKNTESAQHLESERPSSQTIDPRDPDVSDQIWAQLQADKAAAERALVSSNQATQKQQEDLLFAKALEAEKATAHRILAEQSAKNNAEMDELKRLREEARLQEQNARIVREKALAELERLRLIEENRKKEEKRVQSRLREMGVCPVGYRWIRQDGGYRCAAGGHFVTDGQLGL